MLLEKLKLALMIVPIFFMAGCSAPKTVPVDYAALTNEQSKKTIALDMKEEEITGILGKPETKDDESLTDLALYDYGNGLIVGFREGKVIWLMLESAESGYATKIGELTVGKSLEQAKQAYAFEGSPGNGPFDFIHTFKLLIEDNKVIGQPLEAEGTPYYWIECYIDEDGIIYKLLITHHEMIEPPAD
ncbi:hypothetical protein [Cohnella sp.]|uniref:hypothetical protein n=1 Tax=Cohnella sp. TaxID=1883426 RepID=UPI003564C03D